MSVSSVRNNPSMSVSDQAKTISEDVKQGKSPENATNFQNDVASLANTMKGAQAGTLHLSDDDNKALDQMSHDLNSAAVANPDIGQGIEDALHTMVAQPETSSGSGQPNT